jgi:cobalamin biosynthesis Mg chelatase CobN
MRTRVSLVAIVLAGAFAAAAYAGGGAGAVYSDFVQDGKLSCNHSRADLEAVLRSGTLNQYGDPLTLERLKLAVRKQLADGCRKQSASAATSPTNGAGTATTTTQTTTTGTTTAGHGGTQNHKGSKPASVGQHPLPNASAISSQRVANEDNGSFLAGRGLVLILLVAAVALGGWLTKRALSGRG